MSPAVLALPSGLFRLQCHLKSLFLPSLIPSLKAFSSTLAPDTEETPSMKALKDISYPSAPPDPSIFESRSYEYDRVRLPRDILARTSIERATSQRASRPYYASRVLEQLALSEKFAEAEQVRQELAEMKVPIQPSNAYYPVAWNVLRQQPWPPNRTEMFTNWLSLLPGMANNGNVLDLNHLKSALLFNPSHLDLKTIAQFGIIMASKGYIQDVGSSVVACLTRYAEPDASLRSLDAMIAANDEYTAANDECSRSRMGPKYTTNLLWSTAVRTHCTAGRPEVAFQMVRTAHKHDLRLSNFTYQYLLGKLEAVGLNDLAAELRAHTYGSFNIAKNNFVVDYSNLTPIPQISRENSMDENQAIVLAIFERSLQTGSRAYSTELVPYFDIYKAHPDGGEAENLLRSHAYRMSIVVVTDFLLAELLHHHRRGQFKHVLWVFEKFFHVVGVPSKDITRRLLSWHNIARITKTSSDLPAKIWPHPSHTAIVWSALVHLCESEEELFALYDSLLQHGAQFQNTTDGSHHHHHHHHPSHDSSSSTPAIVPAPADRFDAAHFRPFLIAFTHRRNAKYGLRVLDDMQERGIAPSVQFLTTAAALQAGYGASALALRLLGIVRRLIESNGDEEVDAWMEVGVWSEEGPGLGVEERVKKKKKRLLLYAYASVLRGFIERRNIVQARRVADLLHSHVGYVEGGGNERADTVLGFLHRLEVDGPDALPDTIPDLRNLDPEVEADYFYPYLKEPDLEVCPPIYLFIYLFKLHPLPFAFPIPTLSFPSFLMGKPLLLCFFFLLMLRLMEATAQVIKVLTAPPKGL